MKKITSLILVIIFLISGNIAVYGIETDQSADRSVFIDQYLVKMKTIEELRLQTVAARDENNTISKEIKDLKADSNRISIENKVVQIQQIHQTNKDLLTQAKTYANLRTDLRKQWQNAIKDRDTAKSDTTKDQIAEFTKKIEDIRSKITTNKELLSPLITEAREYRDANKAKIEQLKPLFIQTSSIQNKITNEITDKNNLWKDFSSYIKEKNYNQALLIMDSIIAAKQTILADIQTKNLALNEILATKKASNNL